MTIENQEVFARHVYEMMQNPYFRNWTAIVPGKLKYGVTATGPDMNDVIRTIIIKPSARYPECPPITKIIPVLRDPCWDSKGLLHFAEEGDLLSWHKIQHTSNPLIYLVEELLDKYNIAV